MKTEKTTKKENIYKSRPFIKKIYELSPSFLCKYMFNILFLFLTSFVSLILLGLILNFADINIVVVRATLIFTTTWTVVFFIWWLIQTIQYYKLTYDNTRILAIFSFIPVLNFWMMYRITLQINRQEFREWWGWALTESKFSSEINNYKTKQWYLNLATMIVMSPLLYFLFVYSTNNDPFADYHNIWFDGIHYFTIQTNLLCFLYVLIYVIYPKMNLFNNDSVLICLMSYIFIVSITYNTLILPFTMKELLTDNPKYIVKGMWTHTVNPVMFIAVGISNMYTSCKKGGKINDYLSVLKFGMVIPSVYLIYTLCLPFVCNKSVYGPITNCNPYTPNDPPLFGLKEGSPIMLIPIITFWFVFVGIITMFWRIKYAFYDKLYNGDKKWETTSKRLG